MKKRLVAVTLGVILSLSTVGEAGASVFSSPEDTAASQDEIAGSEAAESETDSAKTADTSEVLQMQNHRTAVLLFQQEKMRHSQQLYHR